MVLGRRRLVRSAGAIALVAPFAALFTRRASAARLGPLVPDPNGILDLPAGFSYAVLETTGDPMDDGYRVPGAPDGMECFEGQPGTIVLVRNHELSPGASATPYGPGQRPPPQAYDAGSVGGVTRLVLDAATFARLSSNLVLVGTNRNCAGGRSPWGWLSCEENVDDGHGYVFVCPADAATVAMPQRVVGYGRMNHEAATVDPATNVCYLTEDRGDGCFYRFVPDDPSEPFVGRLQALKILGQDDADLTGLDEIGWSSAVEWVAIDEPDPAGDTVRAEAHTKGAAVLTRGEGIVLGDGVVYFSCTNGGPNGTGQIFALDLATEVLTLVAVSTSIDELDYPDNITLAPWGDLVIAEDGDGGNLLRGLEPDGTLYDVARNALSDSELSGVCFSPDGRALLVNNQGDGLTLAITGPFPRGSGTGGGGAAGAGGTSAGPGVGGGAANAEGDVVEDEGGCGCRIARGAADGVGAAAMAAAAIAAWRRRAC
jgi:uncharacterized repeat protein (TIGR03803 family)